jgi:EAL domain-containing protein (putative c-di-GMP-specific phosphodiesterase class I)
MLAPGAFRDVAEYRELLVPLGAWVLRTACRQAAVWQRRYGSRAPQLWVNISTRQLGRNALTPQVQAVLAETGLEPSRLCLELTERNLLGAAGVARDDLLQIPTLGVHLAVDDFGAGYASMDYLRRFPFQVLKIDKSYVDGLGLDRTDTALTTSMIALGHALGLTVVAEGVETVAQQAQLTALGCDLIQGYLLAEPVSPEHIDDLLTAAGAHVAG